MVTFPRYVPDRVGYSAHVDRQDNQEAIETGHPWMRLVGSPTLWCATCQVPAAQCQRYRDNEYPGSQSAQR